MKAMSINNPVIWIKIILYVLLLGGIYFSTFDHLIEYGWSHEDFGYGYLIPFIVMYLIWEKRIDLASILSKSSWKGLIIFCLGLLLFWVGELGGEYLTLKLSFWVVLLGLCWAHLGWNKLKIISFPLVLMLTMFPPPAFLYRKLSLMLKLISTKLGVAIMQLYGMSAYREGNIVDLGFTQLQVVDACSGLRYLFPLIVLGLLLAYFFKDALWKKIVLVISTIPISIVVNSLRIASVGILYQFWGAAVAEGFFHDFSGWFIFMTSLGILLIEMWALGKIGVRRRKTDEGEQRSEPGDERMKRSVGESGRGEPNAEEKGIRGFLSPPQFVVAVILLGTTLALCQGIEFREKIPINKSLSEFPLQIGCWSGTWQTMEQKFLDELDLSDYVIIDFQSKQGKTVNFYVAYYESQRKGESIHSPATCLPGSGWIFEQAGKKNIPVTEMSGNSMSINRAFMQRGDYKQLAYYWFPMRGRILTNAYQMKIYNFWDALMRQRTDGALVRIITPVYKNEELKDAEERLQEFVGEIVPVLNEYLPQ